jgi:hypothetical protein
VRLDYRLLHANSVQTENSVEQATSATSQLVDRLMTFELREGRGFERQSVLELHGLAIDAVTQLSAIVVELAKMLERQRVVAELSSPSSPAQAAEDQLVRTILELSEEDRQRTYDYVRLMLMSSTRRRLAAT